MEHSEHHPYGIDNKCRYNLFLNSCRECLFENLCRLESNKDRQWENTTNQENTSEKS